MSSEHPGPEQRRSIWETQQPPFVLSASAPPLQSATEAAREWGKLPLDTLRVRRESLLWEIHGVLPSLPAQPFSIQKVPEAEQEGSKEKRQKLVYSWQWQKVTGRRSKQRGM